MIIQDYTYLSIIPGEHCGIDDRSHINVGEDPSQFCQKRTRREIGET